ncbi:helix-turn-helix domain-containing protein [Sulfobacillus thermosulfidooxidans]|uniref:helix-turn-helix domain-containing protein n=1 Tax=Sulfobacillus thermosulfidooxidans TaxID=28034 RepID=UPI0015948E3B|nr:helix-turn-helix transcriptional regulator [Sulfobacillus thermosulfidooxidans]
MLGDRLRAVRKDRGYTQAQVADAAGVSQFTLSHYENGTRQPPCDVLVSISDFLDVSVDFLLGRSDERHYSHLPGRQVPLDVGKRLTIVREARHLSIEQCATLVKVSSDRWRQWEAEERPPTWPQILQIADTFQISLDWLLNRPQMLFPTSEPATISEAEWKRTQVTIAVMEALWRQRISSKEWEATERRVTASATDRLE